MKCIKNNITNFFIFVLLWYPALGFTETKEFTASGTYYMDNFETPSIAEERAVLQAKWALAADMRSYIARFLKSQKIKLTDDQIQALVSLATNYEILDTKKINVDGQVRYDIKIRASVSTDSANKSSSQVTAKLVAEDYKSLVGALNENQKEVDELKKRSKNTASKQEVELIETAIQDKNRLLQSLIYFNQGLDQFIKYEYDRSIELFSKAIDLNQSYVDVYSYRGAAYDRTGQQDAAIKDCKKIIEMNPNNAAAYYNLGSLYVIRGQYDDAIKEFTKAIMHNPSFAEAYTNRGFVYHEEAQYDKAIEDFSKAISLNPSSPGPYYNRGNTYYKKGQYETAIKDFVKAIELYPDYAKAYTARGLAYSALGNREQGLLDVTKACAMNYEEACKLLDRKTPDEIEYDKAWLYLNNQENEKALDTVKQINKPDDIRSVVLLGSIFLRMNRPQGALDIVAKAMPEAEKVFKRVQNKEASSDNGKEALIKKFYYYLFFIRGLAYFQQNDCASAIRDLSIYLKDEKNSIDANEKISICYYQDKRYSESLPYFKRIYEVLKEGPQKDSAAYSISSLNALMGNVDEAIFWLKIPLGHKYRSQVLEKIKNDKDFDTIRNSKTFNKFLKDQEEKIK